MTLSILRSLWGEVGPSLRAVTYLIHQKNKHILAHFYFDGLIEQSDIESMQFSETEVIADFESDWQIEFQAVRLDYPAKIPILEAWVYKRREVQVD